VSLAPVQPFCAGRPSFAELSDSRATLAQIGANPPPVAPRAPVPAAPLLLPAQPLASAAPAAPPPASQPAAPPREGSVHGATPHGGPAALGGGLHSGGPGSQGTPRLSLTGAAAAAYGRPPPPPAHAGQVAAEPGSGPGQAPAGAFNRALTHQTSNGGMSDDDELAMIQKVRVPGLGERGCPCQQACGGLRGGRCCADADLEA
jgi:hypothetical protein